MDSEFATSRGYRARLENTARSRVIFNSLCYRARVYKIKISTRLSAMKLVNSTRDKFISYIKKLEIKKKGNSLHSRYLSFMKYFPSNYIHYFQIILSKPVSRPLSQSFSFPNPSSNRNLFFQKIKIRRPSKVSLSHPLVEI